MGQGITIGTKQFGIIIILIAIALSYILVSFTNEINKTHDEGCSCPETLGYCPHRENSLPNTAVIGILLVIALVAVGALMLIKGKQVDKALSMKKREWEQTLKTLDGDERAVYEIISASDGVVFQSDIVDKTKFPKTKVSRVLDRMEAREIIERRRRGMSNVIVLKR